MIKNILFCLVCCLFSLGMFAQNTVQLNINHQLGGADFGLNQAAENNLNNYFTVSRLEYYISNITITHDEGTETIIEDLHILVDASESGVLDLGSFPITDVESIRFYIGVDPLVNHDDPAAFPNDHPLAPKFPSMHWGWAAGYRYIALEGKGGSPDNLQTLEIHGLGDSNYSETPSIPLTASADNGVVVINLDADYTKLLENIDVSGGLIVHGEDGAAKQSLGNFRVFVFSPTIDVMGTGAETGEGLYSISPISVNTDAAYEWVVTDEYGNIVTTVNTPDFVYDFEFNGTYTLTLNVMDASGQTVSQTQEINISSALVGIEDLINVRTIELYPIPAVDFINLVLTLDDTQKMNISVVNVLGQTVSVVGREDFVQGVNLIKINTADFVNGLYFVNIEAAGRVAVQRFVVGND